MKLVRMQLNSMKTWALVAALNGVVLITPSVASEKLLASDVDIYSSFWKLNGSIIGLIPLGNGRTFEYVVPRENLKKYDIKRKSIWFSGTLTGDTYRGELHVFRAGCSPAPYPATGELAKAPSGLGLSITFEGVAPVRDESCKQIKVRPYTEVITYYKKRLGRDELMPSFDCDLAKHLTERVICEDRQLAAKDSELSMLFNAKLSTERSEQTKTLMSKQKAWIKKRNECGSDRKCLNSVYDFRIKQFP